MQINSIKSLNQNQPSFEKLHMDRKSIIDAGKDVFEGIRCAMIPKEGKLLSDIHELAETNEIFISANPKFAVNNDCLSIVVDRGGKTVPDYAFKTTGYKSAKELGNAITNRVYELYNEGLKTIRTGIVD